MNNQKSGSIYFDKKDNRWKCSYYTFDTEKQIETRKTKSFLTPEEAEQHLKIIQCQQGNSLYIKNNGIFICDVLKILADKKLDANLIKERSIFTNNV